MLDACPDAQWRLISAEVVSQPQTELAAEYATHVVAVWIGDSARITARHYLQVTEEHYDRAAQIPAHSATGRAYQPETGKPAPRSERPRNQGLAR